MLYSLVFTVLSATSILRPRSAFMLLLLNGQAGSYSYSDVWRGNTTVEKKWICKMEHLFGEW